jgi:hypothetical protein
VLRLGAWARAGGLVGIVAAVNESEVALFQPGDRQLVRVSPDQAEAVPAGAVTVTVTVDLPLAHGLAEDTVRRWLATLADPVLRERAAAVLRDAGLDAGATLPAPRVDVRAAEAGGAVCLCGARVPAPPGTALACPACGRQAVSAPVSSPGGGAGPRG